MLEAAVGNRRRKNEKISMSDGAAARLEAFQKNHGFFIGIDSDGCVFDTMEIKHKECFIPQTIKHWSLQKISRYAREAWEFVNLYSPSRGSNRFPALVSVIELLAKRPEVAAREAKLPDLSPLCAWLAKETKVGNPALQAHADAVRDPVLDQTLAWSFAVNEAIKDIVTGIPPFPLVRETLETAGTRADVMVVSQTPLEALRREWREHELDNLVQTLAGQEHGTKTGHIRLAARGRYPAGTMLMLGDAFGDLAAARANNALFFPIVPGKETASWDRFYREGLQRFFTGAFAGSYEEELLREFRASLPETPPWES